ncbi:MAG TPA: ribbon-helix-helix protein, CopG family [Firmicutes bacterium]|uniref:Ribbon-helix-helix protein, CopG family n=1 Tax=Capillibacterium thermochitinicola TaxID=2699427 RepID=A0A8J6HRX5_9FIRM|nr:ribbon-helix-helix protein, CopG family [Capillibacterium thermochitinicola]MBA2132996.1 ribbon-helix-helix protein, CopG family [Capillibacterium thermochitinicola]HHW11472.1 ribbon-helix-helix protein, CopG family [Bacillota bacterium]
MSVKRKNLHVRIEEETYEKLRHLTFYERSSISEVVRRLIKEYLEEKALEEPDFVAPPRL